MWQHEACLQGHSRHLAIQLSNEPLALHFPSMPHPPNIDLLPPFKHELLATMVTSCTFQTSVPLLIKQFYSNIQAFVGGEEGGLSSLEFKDGNCSISTTGHHSLPRTDRSSISTVFFPILESSESFLTQLLGSCYHFISWWTDETSMPFLLRL